MKRSYLVLLILSGLLVATGAFAEGQYETDSLDDQWETVTVTGTISFKDLPTPEITSGGTTYELMVPRFSVTDIDVEAGDTITVEGVLVEPRFADDERTLMVQKAIIDGEEYEVPHGFGSMGRMNMPHRRFDDDDNDRFGRRGRY